MNHVKLIGDLEELKWFYDNVLPPLAPLEVYFLSLSARNKYLTEEERKILELGRTEMFAKTIVRERTWERFVRTIRKLECSEEGYTTKNNSPIPSKCMVCYLNINPSNTIKALYEFQKVYNEYMMELAEVAVKKRDSENIMNRLNKIDNNMLTAYQQATGTRHYIDIDFDINKVCKLHEWTTISDLLKSWGITKYYWIDTKSGYHLLISKDQIKRDPNKMAQTFEGIYLDQCRLANIDPGKYEIIKNDNGMIPLPGCYQADHIVRVLNK